MAQHSQRLTKRTLSPLRLTLTGLGLFAAGYLTRPIGSVLMIVGGVLLLSVISGRPAQDLIASDGGESEE